jgi:outer membrane biosynthesis protein TonB
MTMTIEANLERIADALELIASKLDGVAPEPAATADAPEKPAKAEPKANKPKPAKPAKPAKTKAPEPPEEEEDEGSDEGEPQGPYLADVRNALTGYAKRTDSDTARALLKKVGGAETLSKLPESKYQAIIDAVEAA